MSAGLAVVLAVTQGAEETVAVLAGLVVGTAYSMPPLRLKRFPLAASLCISGVRSVVVNLGVYAHFSLALARGRWRSRRRVGADDRRRSRSRSRSRSSRTSPTPRATAASAS